MEETTVVIVGAGPTGLSLAVTLGRMNIKTIILEKTSDVNQDPRGIAIAGDAVRISHRLGVGPALTTKIGQIMPALHFHRGSFMNSPFMNFDQHPDWLQQSVPTAVVQFQPEFEQELRAEIDKLSSSVIIRSNCEVFDRLEELDTVVVHYKDREGTTCSIRANWLIGADGKRGVVRKKFLEPEGVKQEVGLYKYEGTWIAANLEITAPTPETHPKLALWKIGYTPDEVCETFWPSGFHFCHDTKRPAVSGRFGPDTRRFWRHEYSTESGDPEDDPIREFWKQFGSWISLPRSYFRGYIEERSVAFPRDCINVLRCQSFRFETKVVNQWFCRKTILIGDAAHVFPPFGGQGIAAGLRDALSLGWRLGMIERAHLSSTVRQKLLTGWAHEQRQRIDEATQLTLLNGRIVNQRSWILAFFDRLLMRVVFAIPIVASMLTRRMFGDNLQLTACSDGFFLRNAGGGRRLTQIWVQGRDGSMSLSDNVILRQSSRLALLVLVDRPTQATSSEMLRLLRSANFAEDIISMHSVTFLSRYPATKNDDSKNHHPVEGLYYPCTRSDLEKAGIVVMEGYNEKSILTRVGETARFVVVRPDLFIHSVARTVEELSQNLADIKDFLS